MSDILAQVAEEQSVGWRVQGALIFPPSRNADDRTRTMTLNATPLWHWITERHRIYLKRLAGDPPPWTQDETLQRYRFCNVFRELDNVTGWLRENWRDPYAANEHLWIAM